MRSSAFLALTLALLAVTAGANEVDEGVVINKCCDAHEMLSADGESCVRANWQRNSFLNSPDVWENMPPESSDYNLDLWLRNFPFAVAPEDSEWVRRWLPPGLPIENIKHVELRGNSESVFRNLISVNSSSLLNTRLLLNEPLRKNTVTFLGRDLISRPKPGGGYREAKYCADAAPPPLGPFVLRFKTLCRKGECAKKCCEEGQMHKDNEGHWKCKVLSPDYWMPNKSSLVAFDSEFPYTIYNLCERPRLVPFEDRYGEWARHSGGIHSFQFSTWTTCFDFYRTGDDSFKEGLFYCEYSRITRGVYLLVRPLSFLSSLLLLVSLLSVACDKKMQRKIHGRCLASHAACLLAFNIGQIIYYIEISNRLDAEVVGNVPQDLQTVCKYFALLMYFLLTSSWIWLTALCANMARGFSLHMPRLDKGSGKKFLAISACVWGLSTVLTITCSILFTQPEDYGEHSPWYTPSLMETRVCFIEPVVRQILFVGTFIKSGTALFYYGPVCCLVVCNIICLVLTLRKVHYLKRGNSVLRREEDQIPLGQRHTEGNNPPTAHTATGNGRTPHDRKRSGTTVDAKTIKLYIKMVLISGGIELLTEVIMWLTTQHSYIYKITWNTEHYRYYWDKDLTYRAAGYVTDFFRAVIVTWMAAPEGGYLGLVMRMLRRDMRVEKSAGDVGRRKQNVA